MIICTPIPNSFDPVKCEYDVIYFRGSDVWLNRLQACKEALRVSEDLLLLDSDVLTDKKDIARLQLESRRLNSVVSGAYVSRRDGEKYEAGFFDGADCPVDKMIDRSFKNTVKVDYTGGGFLYIPLDVLTQLEEPYFFPIWDSVRGSDDIGFCYKLKEKNIPLYLAGNIKAKGHEMEQQQQQQVNIGEVIASAKIRSRDNSQAIAELCIIIEKLFHENVRLTEEAGNNESKETHTAGSNSPQLKRKGKRKAD